GSTFRTSAPISARSWVAYGPGRQMVRSSTRIPSSCDTPSARPIVAESPGCQLAQRLRPDLGVGGERELRLAHEQHPSGDLVRGQPTPQKAAHLLFADVGAVVGDGADHDL